jgi:hypothetical protein
MVEPLPQDERAPPQVSGSRRKSSPLPCRRVTAVSVRARLSSRITGCSWRRARSRLAASVRESRRDRHGVPRAHGERLRFRPAPALGAGGGEAAPVARMPRPLLPRRHELTQASGGSRERNRSVVVARARRAPRSRRAREAQPGRACPARPRDRPPSPGCGASGSRVRRQRPSLPQGTERRGRREAPVRRCLSAASGASKAPEAAGGTPDPPARLALEPCRARARRRAAAQDRRARARAPGARAAAARPDPGGIGAARGSGLPDRNRARSRSVRLGSWGT